MPRLKIVHLSSVHPRYDNRILLKQCCSLSNAGHEVSLIVADGKGEEIFQGVKIYDVGESKNLLNRMLVKAFAVYTKANQLNPDVYQIHDPELLPYAFILSRRGKKVIYDVHEDYVTGIGQKKYLPEFLKGIVARGFNSIEKFFSKKCTVILAEKYYQERFPAGHLVLNYPVLSTSGHEGTDTYPIQVAGKELIYTGNVTEVRGAFTQSKIIKALPDVKITFIGYCPSELAEKMKEIAGPHSENLEIIGKGEFIPFAEIKKKYVEKSWVAGLAIFPKTPHYEKKELTKFFEYMANGLPIICTNFPVWKKLIEGNDCGIAVDPNDIGEIKEAINRLYEDKSLRERMIKNGKRLSQSKFNWEVEKKHLLEIYSNLK